MKKIFKFLLYLIATTVVVVAAFVVYDSFFNEEPYVFVPDVDTVFVSIASEPDTVYLYKKIEKYVTIHDTIYSDPAVVVDTVYLDTTIYVYRSEKTFKWPYVSSFVYGYAGTKIDSFGNKVTVNWNNYINDNIRPGMDMAMKQQRNRGRLEGVIATAVVGTLVLFLVR